MRMPSALTTLLTVSRRGVAPSRMLFTVKDTSGPDRIQGVEPVAELLDAFDGEFWLEECRPVNPALTTELTIKRRQMSPNLLPLSRLYFSCFSGLSLSITSRQSPLKVALS